MVSKPSFISQKISSKYFVSIHEIKLVLTLDKSIYVGFSILNLSKLLMYKLHYNYVKGRFNDNLLFTDMDSLVCEIETKYVYEDFYRNKNVFNFSDYPQHPKFFDLVNKKVIGTMKNEYKGKIICEFVGLKSKMYSLTVADGKEIKKAKGANKGHTDVLFNKKW